MTVDEIFQTEVSTVDSIESPESPLSSKCWKASTNKHITSQYLFGQSNFKTGNMLIFPNSIGFNWTLLVLENL